MGDFHTHISKSSERPVKIKGHPLQKVKNFQVKVAFSFFCKGQKPTVERVGVYIYIYRERERNN